MSGFYEVYNKKNNDELIRFAKYEAEDLRPEAFSDLIIVLEKKGIDQELIAKLKEKNKLLSEESINRIANKLMRQPCPKCGSNDGINAKKLTKVYSFIVFTKFSGKTYLCCKECMKKEMINASLLSIVAGIWGFPFGIFGAPIVAVGNVISYFRFDLSNPTQELKDYIKANINNSTIANLSS